MNWKALLVALAIALPAAADTVCIGIYPSSFDPGVTSHKAVRVDVAASSSTQGFTVYSFGPEGDPATFSNAFFHFTYPFNKTGALFQPVVWLTSGSADNTKQGCYTVSATASTAGTVYENITGAEGNPVAGTALISSNAGDQLEFSTGVLHVWNGATNAECSGTECQRTMVVGLLTRLTDPVLCTNSDPFSEAVTLIEMCYAVP